MNSYKWSDLYQKLLIDFNEIFSDYIIETLSDEEKRKIIYDYFIDNFEYDYTLFDKIKIAHDSGIKFRRYKGSELADTIFNHKGIYNGLNQYYKLLLEEAGIPAYYVYYKYNNDYFSSFCIICTEDKNKVTIDEKKHYNFSIDDVVSGVLNKDKKSYFNYNADVARDKYKQGIEYINGAKHYEFLDNPYINNVLLKRKSFSKNSTKVSKILDSQKYNVISFLNNNSVCYEFPELNTFEKAKYRRR